MALRHVFLRILYQYYTITNKYYFKYKKNAPEGAYIKNKATPN